MSKDTSGQAFPQTLREIVTDSKTPTPFPDFERTVHLHGLTKREWFAGMALEGLLSNANYGDGCGANHVGAAYEATHYADALLAELNKEKSC